MKSDLRVPAVRWIVALLVFSVSAGAVPAAAQDLPQVRILRDIFGLEEVHTDLAFPTGFAIAPAPDNRVFYIERYTGNIRVIEDGIILPTPFATVPNIETAGLGGLLSIVLHPDFATTTPALFVYYSEQTSPPPPLEPTWRSIQDTVFHNCLGCHGGPTPAVGLSLEESVSWESMVGVTSVQVPSMKRILAGDPNNSYLVRKLEDAAGIVGDPMPPTGLLDQETVDVIRTWISQGAQKNGEAPPPATPPRNRIIAYDAAGNVAGGSLVILDDIPWGGTHSGGGMAFGPDGKLYVQTGDQDNPALSPNLGSLAGKILRLNDNGTIPSDNPFVGTAGAREEIFSYGHRNGFGLAPDTLNGMNPLRIYVSENGPDFNDELNVARAGLNYGWPFYQGNQQAMCCEEPLYTWFNTVSPVGIVQYSGGFYHPSFVGDLFVGLFNLADVDPNPILTNKISGRIERFELTGDGTGLARRSIFFDAIWDDLRRPVSLVQGPDGMLYFSVVEITTNKGGIYRIVKTDDDNDGCGNANDPFPSTWGADNDGDSYGFHCDCNDLNAAVNPGAEEIPGNGLDDDCNPDTPGPGCGPAQIEAATVRVGAQDAADLGLYALAALGFAAAFRRRRR